jgi:hypothetical protein
MAGMNWKYWQSEPDEFQPLPRRWLLLGATRSFLIKVISSTRGMASGHLI